MAHQRKGKHSNVEIMSAFAAPGSFSMNVLIEYCGRLGMVKKKWIPSTISMDASGLLQISEQSIDEDGHQYVSFKAPRSVQLTPQHNLSEFKAKEYLLEFDDAGVLLHYFYLQEGFIFTKRVLKIAHRDSAQLNLLQYKLQSILQHTWGEPDLKMEVKIEFCRLGKVLQKWSSAVISVHKSGIVQIFETTDERQIYKRIQLTFEHSISAIKQKKYTLVAGEEPQALHYFYIQSGFLFPTRDIKIAHPNRGQLQALKLELEEVLRSGGDPDTEVDVMVEFCDRMGRVSHKWCAAACTIDNSGSLRIKEIVDNDEDISGGGGVYDSLQAGYEPSSSSNSPSAGSNGGSGSSSAVKARAASAGAGDELGDSCHSAQSTPRNRNASIVPYMKGDPTAPISGYKQIDLTENHQVTEFKSKTYTLDTLSGPMTVVLHYFYIIRGMMGVREIKIGSDDLTLLGELASSVQRTIRGKTATQDTGRYEDNSRDSQI